MIEIIHEIIVREEHRARFELVFGPGGAWGNLFGAAKGFRGTALLRDTDNPNRYLITDVWNTLEDRDAARAEHAPAYADLEADLAALTESWTELGVFRMRAEANVKPQGTRSKVAAARRQSGRSSRRG